MNALKKDLKRNYSLYLIFLPTVIFFVIFSYGPMVGLLMAFQNYKPQLGFSEVLCRFQAFPGFFPKLLFLEIVKKHFFDQLSGSAGWISSSHYFRFAFE